MNSAAVILAGGQSTRMGHNKAFLQIGQEKFIERMVREFNMAFKQVVIVTNQPSLYDYLGVDVVSDIIPGFGPLSGVHAGLSAAKYDYSLITACDMPFARADLGITLVKMSEGFDVTVPVEGNYLQPLFAVYRKSCLGYVEESLNEGISKVYAFYPKVKVNYIQQNMLVPTGDVEKAFLNVNTPEDLNRALNMEMLP